MTKENSLAIKFVMVVFLSITLTSLGVNPILSGIIIGSIFIFTKK